MQFLLLSVLCLFISTTKEQMNSTQLEVEVRHLIQKPPKEPNVMRKNLNGKHNFFGIVDLEKENDVLIQLWVFSLFLIIASLIKLGYHQSHFLTTTIPESCVLIMIGIGFGTINKIFKLGKKIPKFSVDLFIFGLMPPYLMITYAEIILESSFALNNEYFFGNLITIIMYAVAGTLINELLIGTSLYLLTFFNVGFLNYPKLSLIELLIFSNAISAVDPVTVLTIFQDLKVNKPLYYLVFGESLFNDAVVIVVHSLLDGFAASPLIDSWSIINGFNSFFYTSLGGFGIGVVFGLLTALITLYTRHSLVIEPMIMIGMAYCSFLSSDLIGWSGLISLIGCGLVQYEFAFENISRKTRITVKYFISTLSSVCDLLIFFFLGQMLINEDQEWNTPFVIFTILFCLIYRTVSVFLLTYISNNYFHRTRPINLEEQALMAYGGLRGAVAFAMIALLEDNREIESVRLLKTTTYVLIFFTVFVLGGTTKPLLNLLRIQREAIESKKLCFTLNDKVIDIVINGIEDFVGNASTMSALKQYLQKSIKYLKKYLCIKNQERIEHEIPKLLTGSNIDSSPSSASKDDGEFSDHKISGHVEDFPKKIEANARKIQTNKKDFIDIVSQKSHKSIFIVQEVIRKHNFPQVLSSEVIDVNQSFKSSGQKFSALISESTTALIETFKSDVPLKSQIEDKKSEPKIDEKT